jgi:AcrR family transcriptional regulator
MKKNITKEQIIETALALTRHKSDLHGLNLREIARELGCAHTNLYNYFSSYNDLLWETRAALQENFTKAFEEKLAEADTTELKLACLFETFIDMYIDNKGWFRLAWHEYIGSKRPERDVEAVKTTNDALNRHALKIYKEFSGNSADDDKHVKQVLHNTGCYIAGEISNYFSGRSDIQNEDELKAHVSYEALRLFLTCLKLV